MTNLCEISPAGSFRRCRASNARSRARVARFAFCSCSLERVSVVSLAPVAAARAGGDAAAVSSGAGDCGLAAVRCSAGLLLLLVVTAVGAFFGLAGAGGPAWGEGGRGLRADSRLVCGRLLDSASRTCFSLIRPALSSSSRRELLIAWSLRHSRLRSTTRRALFPLPGLIGVPPEAPTYHRFPYGALRVLACCRSARRGQRVVDSGGPLGLLCTAASAQQGKLAITAR